MPGSGRRPCRPAAHRVGEVRGPHGRGPAARAREAYVGAERAPVDQIATARSLLEGGAIDETEYRLLKDRALRGGVMA